MNTVDRERFGDPASCVDDSGARPSVSRAQFRPARPSGSLRGGRGVGVPDELLGLAGRNGAIGAVTGRHFSSGTLNKTWWPCWRPDWRCSDNGATRAIGSDNKSERLL